MKEINELSNEELQGVAGGNSTQDIRYNLNNFGYRTVHVPAGTLLVMQETPRGAFMSTYYVDGEPILINLCYSEPQYLLAYKNGVFGYVDMQYVVL